MVRRDVLAFWLLAIVPAVASADDATISGELIVEPPTLVSLGFEWMIEGDDNHNASATVRCAADGSETWITGPPMLRVGGERINENALQYTTPNMLAGSVFDLTPDTDYETVLQIEDARGPFTYLYSVENQAFEDNLGRTPGYLKGVVLPFS